MSIGKYKKSKNILNNFGKTLETFGNVYNQIWNSKPIQSIYGAIGQGVGMATIPIIGGIIGKEAATSGAELRSDVGKLTSKIGQAIQGKYGWKDIGNGIINYIPNKFKDSTIYKVINKETTIPDAIINKLEESAWINILAPNRTHAWKDKQGNYYKTYKPGTKMVVGEWKNNPGSNRKPITDNGKVTGITSSGEVIRN